MSFLYRAAAANSASYPYYTIATTPCTTPTQTNCLDSPPFAANVPANTDATDLDFGSHLVMVTDFNTYLTTSSYDIGDTGDASLFSANSGMLMVTQSGETYLVYLNPSRIRSGVSCSLAPNAVPPTYPATACSYNSQIATGAIGSCTTNCTQLDSSGSFAFSRTDPYAIFELEGNDTTMNELTICDWNRLSPYCGSGVTSDTFTRTLYEDVAASGILPTGYVATWHGPTVMAQDGSFTLGLAGGADWIASHAYIANDYTSMIVPQTGNSSHYGFIATTAGTTSGTEPTWSTCKTAGYCTDGGVTWTYIGVIHGQNTGYDLINYTAGAGWSAVNTYLGQVRRGSTGTASTWPSGTWQTDDPFLCQPYWYANSITPGSAPCPFSMAPYPLHSGNSQSNPAWGYLSTAGAGSSNYAGGTYLGSSALYFGPWNSTQSYPNVNATVSVGNGTSLAFYSLPSGTTFPFSGGNAPPASPWVLTGIGGYGMEWNVSTLTFRSCTEIQCDGHNAEGYNNKWSGPNYAQYTLTAPSKYVCLTNAVYNPTTAPHTYYLPNFTTYPATGCAAGDLIFDEPNPGSISSTSQGYGYANSWSSTTLFPTAFSGDFHDSDVGLGLSDNGPLTLFVASVPFTTTGAAAPYAQEIVGATTGLNGSPTAGTRYRFAHNFATGSSPLFDAQNAIGAISQDGNWAAQPTDMMGLRGSVSPAWVSGASHTWGDLIYPTTYNCGWNGSGSNSCASSWSASGFEYMVTAIGGNPLPNPNTAGTPTSGTSGSTAIQWDAYCTTTCTDGTGSTQLTWTRQPYSCNRVRANKKWATIGASGTPATGDAVFGYLNGNDVYLYISGSPTGTSEPAWASWCPNFGNCPSLDGSVQWFNAGQNSCRSDIMLVDLVSAH
jgi:hypothetical protein